MEEYIKISRQNYDQMVEKINNMKSKIWEYEQLFDSLHNHKTVVRRLYNREQEWFGNMVISDDTYLTFDIFSDDQGVSELVNTIKGLQDEVDSLRKQ